MSSTINETVETAMQARGLGGYMSQARPVVDALVARETDMATQLIAYAVEQGLGMDDATRAISGVGMHLPAPTPVTFTGTPENVNETDLAAVLGRINQRLDEIEAR